MDRMLCAPRTYEEELQLAKEAAAVSSSTSPVANAEKVKEDMQTHAAQIELDLQRTFPNHADFRMEGKGGPGGNGSKLEPLRRILLALAHAHAEARMGILLFFPLRPRVFFFMRSLSNHQKRLSSNAR